MLLARKFDADNSSYPTFAIHNTVLQLIGLTFVPMMGQFKASQAFFLVAALAWFVIKKAKSVGATRIDKDLSFTPNCLIASASRI